MEEKTNKLKLEIKKRLESRHGNHQKFLWYYIISRSIEQTNLKCDKKFFERESKMHVRAPTLPKTTCCPSRKSLRRKQVFSTDCRTLLSRKFCHGIINNYFIICCPNLKRCGWFITFRCESGSHFSFWFRSRSKFYWQVLSGKILFKPFLYCIFWKIILLSCLCLNIRTVNLIFIV